MFRCKIMTDDFLFKVNHYIMDYVKDLTGVEREREVKRIRSYLCLMWNNPHMMVDRPEVKEYYERLGIYTPDYKEILFVGKGSPSNPSITWLHEVKKISEIDEIFSYQEVPI